jgi:site-specific recombinase XerD
MILSTAQALDAYDNHLAAKGYSMVSRTRYRSEIASLVCYLASVHGVTEVRSITRDHITAFFERLADDDRLAANTRRGIMSSLRGLFRYLMQNEYLVENPFDGVTRGFRVRIAERTTVSEEQMRRLLEGIAGNDPATLRDRAIFELFYATGIRVGELVKLDVTDVQVKTATVHVREGKGKKDRFLPLTKVARDALVRYLRRGRRQFRKRRFGKADKQALFLGYRGTRLSRDRVERLVKKYVAVAGLPSAGMSPHMFRHSVATHLLNRGADIRYVQELLGHESVETTVIYTHVGAEGLRKTMKRFHPREHELFEEV